MSSSPPFPSETPAEYQTVALTTDSSSLPPPPPPSDQGGESSGDFERPNSSATGGDGEKNGGEREAGEVGEEQEDEEGECGFCLFMKGGGCKEEFIAWEKCVEEADQTGEDVVSKCFEVTSLLKKCMDAHADYYAPILDAEKAMTDAAATATTTPDSE
ncbi:putative proline-rich receptor-like protein kinase PERK6 [Cocos nucifera]|nr:putative proline-rich receptor-like protein kinase PERK6 [Cocos nucifera]